MWTESRSLAGVLHDDCRELAVSLYPCGGFASETLCYEAAQGIRYALENDGKTGASIIYVGDYDPAGVLIDHDIESKLRKHLEGVPLVFTRVAVTREQIASMGLPTKPRKPTDRRRPDVLHTVEAEAIPAGQLRQLVRRAVESYLPAGRLAQYQEIDRQEQQGLRRLAQLVETGQIGIEGFMVPVP